MRHRPLRPDVLIALLVQNEGSKKHARPSDRAVLPRDASGRTLIERINGELEPSGLREPSKGDGGLTLEERINGPLEPLGSKKRNKRLKKASGQPKSSINRKRGQQKSMTPSATQVHHTSFSAEDLPLRRSTTFTGTKETQKRGLRKHRKAMLDLGHSMEEVHAELEAKGLVPSTGITGLLHSGMKMSEPNPGSRSGFALSEPQIQPSLRDDYPENRRRINLNQQRSTRDELAHYAEGGTRKKTNYQSTAQQKRKWDDELDDDLVGELDYDLGG